MAGIKLSLDGTLIVARYEESTSAQARVSPQEFTLGLRTVSGLATSGSEISQGCFTINSPAAFVTLAFPSSLRAQVFYLKPLTANDGPFDVRLTHATALAVVYPSQRLTLIQVDEDEAVSAVAVQGVGSFEWVAAGLLV